MSGTASRRPPTVVLFGRDGCCLCDEARDVLLQAREKHLFTLEERDIERDEELLRMYLERIPVVTIDGREAFEFFVEADRLEDLLNEAQRSTDP